MCGSSVIVEVIRWRRSNAQPTLQQIAQVVLPNYQQEAASSLSLARPAGFPNRVPADVQGPEIV